MSHPAYRHDPQTEAPADLEDVFVLHSSLMTGLHQERALNVYDAFGQWTRHENLEGFVHAGQLCSEPYRHLSVAFQTSGELHEVHVIRERELEARGDLRC